MPNVKFSQFTAVNPVASTGFLVGYDSATNLNTRVTLADLTSSILSPVSPDNIPYNNSGAIANSYLWNSAFDQTLSTGITSGSQYPIFLDFQNDYHYFGYGATTQIVLFPGSSELRIGDGAQAIGAYLSFANSSQLIRTFNNIGNLIGLGLDFSTNKYSLGSYGIPLGVHFEVDTANGYISAKSATDADGFYLDLSGTQYDFGYLISSGSNDTYIHIEPDKIETKYNNNKIGIDLDYASSVFKFGNPSGIYFQVDNSGISGWNGLNPLGFQIGNGTSQEFGSGGTTKLVFDNSPSAEKFTFDAGNNVALEYEYQTSITKVGKGGSNTSYMEVDGGFGTITLFSDNDIRLNDNGTGNMISNTSGGSSGDYLVITVNGIQYKIALDTP
jgi:hypothetical protein